MSPEKRIKLASPFRPLWAPARYKAAYGGRGSGKSHNFAAMLVHDAMNHPGLRAVCVREVLRDLKDSAKLLIEDKIEAHDATGFRTFKGEIETPGGGIIIFRGMQDYNSESIKSLEGFDRAWIEEAQTLSRRSLELLRPTIRKPGSEIWASWNPRHERDPVDRFFRQGAAPPNSVIVRANWSDNPWFPAELETERLFDIENNPDRYSHIWEGEYEPAAEGAYYANEFAKIDSGGRVSTVPYDPSCPVTTAWDLGISDDTVIWFAQRVGREVRIIDYYANHGQAIDHYARHIQQKPYVYAEHIVPHDADKRELGSGVSVADQLRNLGIKDVRSLPRESIELGIQKARVLLAKCWFDQEKCKDGIEALRQYRRDWDEKRQVFRDNPLHDWASHPADGFRYLAMGWKEELEHDEPKPPRYQFGKRRRGGKSWMAA